MLSIIVVILSGIALTPLSCIMLWGRYISFTDSLIHACIFGGFISQILQIDSLFGMILSDIFLWCIAINVSFRQDNYTVIRSGIANINILYLISMFMSSIAIGFGVNYNQLLFGNILFVTEKNLIELIIFIIIIFIFLIKYKKDLYLMYLNEDLALGLGIKVHFLQKFSLLLIIFTISLVIRILGGGFFIIGAMILPSMIALIFSTNPSYMIIIATFISIINNLISIIISENFDIDFSPTTIIFGSMTYFFIKIGSFFIKNEQKF